MVALFAFAVGIFVDRGLTAVGSLDLSGSRLGAPTPVPAGSADPSQKPTGDDAFALIRESCGPPPQGVRRRVRPRRPVPGACRHRRDDRSRVTRGTRRSSRPTRSRTPKRACPASTWASGPSSTRATTASASRACSRQPGRQGGLGVGDEITAVDARHDRDGHRGRCRGQHRGAAGTTVELDDRPGRPGPDLAIVTLTRANDDHPGRRLGHGPRFRRSPTSVSTSSRTARSRSS